MTTKDSLYCFLYIRVYLKISLKVNNHNHNALLHWCAELTLPEHQDVAAALPTQLLWPLHRNRMDPHPKFGSDVKNSDAIHTPRGNTKIYCLYHEALQGEQRSPLPQPRLI